MTGFKKYYLNDAVGHSAFREFIDKLDIGDIIRIQFSYDLSSVAIVFLKEIRKLDRHEYDSQLPIENLQMGTMAEYKFPIVSGGPKEPPVDITYLPGEELPHEEMKSEIINQNNNKPME